MQSQFDAAAQVASTLGMAKFPTQHREGILRELGRIQAESRKEGATASGWRSVESASLAKAYEAAARLKASQTNEAWRALRACWALVALR